MTEDTRDLTDGEKLNLILADLGDVRARLTALEAQGANTTRPLLDQLIKEVTGTRDMLAERIDGIEKELAEVRRDLRSIDRKFDILNREIEMLYKKSILIDKICEVRNLIKVADLIIRMAKERKESRGLHFSIDYPKPNEKGTIYFNPED